MSGTLVKRALIIGISGQDGTYLAQWLLEQGYEVHGASRDHEVAPLSGAERLGIRDRLRMHSLSLTDFRSVVTVVQRVRPDEIYNLGGQSSVALSFSYPVETFESIAVGTLNLLECVRLLGLDCRIYNAGSSEVFGNTPVPATEDTAFRPRSPYAAAKAAAQHAVANYREAYGLFACTGILFNHESPLRPARFVTRKIVRAAAAIRAGAASRLELGRIDIRRDWGWAPEYVRSMERMLQRPEPRDYLIATGVSHSLESLVDQVFRCYGLDWRKHVTTSATLMRPSDIDVSAGDPSLARRELGWEARVDFEGLVQRLVEGEERSG